MFLFAYTFAYRSLTFTTVFWNSKDKQINIEAHCKEQRLHITQIPLHNQKQNTVHNRLRYVGSSNSRAVIKCRTCNIRFRYISVFLSMLVYCSSNRNQNFKCVYRTTSYGSIYINTVRPVPSKCFVYILCLEDLLSGIWHKSTFRH
jgi:hypothetical protein